MATGTTRFLHSRRRWYVGETDNGRISNRELRFSRKGEQAVRLEQVDVSFAIDFIGEGNTLSDNICLTRTGSAVGLSPNDADLFVHKEDALSSDASETSGPGQGPAFVGSIVKQEPGRLTVMFPRQVPGLDDPRNLWRSV